MGTSTATQVPAGKPGKPPKPDSYAWVALANTTAAIFMASLDGSVVIIALPAIFRGINLDPLSADAMKIAAVVLASATQA